MHSVKITTEDVRETDEVRNEYKPLLLEENNQSDLKSKFLEFDFLIYICSGVMDMKHYFCGSNELLEGNYEIESRIVKLDCTPQEYTTEEGTNYVEVLSNEEGEMKRYYARIDYKTTSEEEDHEEVQKIFNEVGLRIKTSTLEIGESHTIYVNNQKKETAYFPQSLYQIFCHLSGIKDDENGLLKDLSVLLSISSLVVCQVTQLCWCVCMCLFLLFVIIFSTSISGNSGSASAWRIITLIFTSIFTIICAIPCCFTTHSIIMDFVDDLLRRQNRGKKDDDNHQNHNNHHLTSIREIIIFLVSAIFDPKKILPDESKPLNTIENKRYVSKGLGEGCGICLRVFGVGLLCAGINFWCILVFIGYLIVFRESSSHIVMIALGVILPSLCVFCIALLFFCPLFGYFLELHYSMDDDDDEEEDVVKKIDEKQQEEDKENKNNFVEVSNIFHPSHVEESVQSGGNNNNDSSINDNDNDNDDKGNDFFEI